MLIALGGLGLVAQVSSGARRRVPVAHIACRQHAAPGCMETGTDTLGPNSYGSEQTDIVPNTTTSATEQVAPAPGSDLAAFDGIWKTVVQGSPDYAKVKSTFANRVITCHKGRNGILIRMRPKKRGVPLRKVVGPHLQIGFSNSGQLTGSRAGAGVRRRDQGAIHGSSRCRWRRAALMS